MTCIPWTTRYSAGDVLPVEVGKRWQEKYGKPIFQGYGATETCGGVAMCPTDIDNPPKASAALCPAKHFGLWTPLF